MRQKIHTVNRLEDMFVNDKDMWAASNCDENEDEITAVITDFQRASQAWERIFFASGGLLELHKIYWWLVAWIWEKRYYDNDDGGLKTRYPHPLEHKLSGISTNHVPWSQ